MRHKTRIAVALAAILSCVLVAPASAERPFSTRFSENAAGDLRLTGNTLLTCPAAAAGCAAAQAGGNANNNAFVMERVDADADGSTFTSSSADLDLPAGAQVLFAGLYYGARTSAGTGGAAAPAAAARATVKLRPPGAPGYTTLAAAVDDGVLVAQAYAAFVDVTAQVAAAGPGTYTVADVQSGTGNDRYAGWGLVVAYSHPDEPARNLTVFDGLQTITRRCRSGSPASGPRRAARSARRSASSRTRATAARPVTPRPRTAWRSRTRRTPRTTSSTARSRGSGRRSRPSCPTTATSSGWTSSPSTPRGGSGELANGVSVAGAAVDPVRADNLRVVRVAVLAEQSRARVRLTKTGTAGGRAIRYRIVLRSVGPDPARELTVCDALPRALALTRSPGARVRAGRPCWTVPELAAGERRTFSLTARMAATGVIRNTARVRGVNVRAVAAQARVRLGSRSRACASRRCAFRGF